MVKTIVLALIRFYQMCVSPLLAPRCRFYPTCSEYGQQAVRKYGVVRGMAMLMKRIMRCHPWGASGYDPVK
ncbi:MAG: membrane protein insertion efficiency factor YidD [Firmicutes bacterium]|jgi:putative membrane protein insertion efficiency factor|nr:membrane protein insertion efficiency factor YidD [Bacillota bacterium]